MAKPNAFAFILKPIRHALKSIAKNQACKYENIFYKYQQDSNTTICELVAFQTYI